MHRLKLTLGCGPYDRTEALRNGTVRPSGVDLTYVAVDEARNIFARMIKEREFDFAEMSGAFYLGRRAQALAGGEPFPFVAIPVFPSRRFRHSSIFVNAEAGIESPKDLEGRRVGVTQHRVTAALWIRGLLEGHYGVDFGQVELLRGGVSGALNTPDVAELRWTDLDFPMHRPVELASIPAGTTMSDQLAEGEIDALISPRVPTSLHDGRPVKRLFDDPRAVELRYYRETGIFPIMHTIVMTEDAYERHPWTAEVMYDAFVRARDHALGLLERSGAPKTMLPWQIAALEEMYDLSPRGMWAYGLEPNRAALETLVGYLAQQGFIAEPVPIESLFVPVVETAN